MIFVVDLPTRELQFYYFFFQNKKLGNRDFVIDNFTTKT